MDPTRTLLIREQFIREIKRRVGRLKRAIWDFLVTKDALGLKKVPVVEGFVHNVEPREFQFATDQQKQVAFSSWLDQQIEQEILFATLGSGIISVAASGFQQAVSGVGFGGSLGTGPWTTRYIESAYKKGLINAFLAARQALAVDDPNFIDQTQAEFLRTAFLAPERISKVQLLASRSFEQLKGFGARTAAQLNTILAQGILDGKSISTIAGEMLDKIDGLTETQAFTIARTEIIHAHSEGQLDSYEDLGIDRLGVELEWSTAGDNRVCPICVKLEGKVFTVAEARGKIPIHPNCRCAFIPVTP